MLHSLTFSSDPVLCSKCVKHCLDCCMLHLYTSSSILSLVHTTQTCLTSSEPSGLTAFLPLASSASELSLAGYFVLDTRLAQRTLHGCSHNTQCRVLLALCCIILVLCFSCFVTLGLSKPQTPLSNACGVPCCPCLSHPVCTMISSL